jgi:hypothetical protein
MIGTPRESFNELPPPSSMISFSAPLIAPMLYYIFLIPSLPRLRLLGVGMVMPRKTLCYLKNALMLEVFRDLLGDRALSSKLLPLFAYYS